MSDDSMKEIRDFYTIMRLADIIGPKLTLKEAVKAGAEASLKEPEKWGYEEFEGFLPDDELPNNHDGWDVLQRWIRANGARWRRLYAVGYSPKVDGKNTMPHLNNTPAPGMPPNPMSNDYGLWWQKRQHSKTNTTTDACGETI